MPHSKWDTDLFQFLKKNTEHTYAFALAKSRGDCISPSVLFPHCLEAVSPCEQGEGIISSTMPLSQLCYYQGENIPHLYQPWLSTSTAEGIWNISSHGEGLVYSNNMETQVSFVWQLSDLNMITIHPGNSNDMLLRSSSHKKRPPLKRNHLMFTQVRACFIPLSLPEGKAEEGGRM